MTTNEQSRPRKQSAIVTRATLDRQRGAFERVAAAGLLLISFAGTIAVTSGGWAALFAAPQPGAILTGIAIQLALTAAEWWYGAGRGPWRYRVALCIDTGLTVAGYGPLIAPALIAYLAERGAGAQNAALVAWPLIVIASAALAWYPEKTLID